MRDSEKSTMSNLDELERLLEAATPGPWFRQGTLVNGPDEGGIDIGPLLMDVYSERDAALIVAAVNSLPALIAAARRAEALEKAVQEVLAADGAVARGAVGADRLWDAALAGLDAVLEEAGDATDA